MSEFYSSKMLSVSELTAQIKSILGFHFQSVRVRGEVSNCRPSAAGHVYFTLKDDSSVISVALFRNRASQTGFKICDGMQVVIEGKLEVYSPRGSYQIIAEGAEEVGIGSILEELERRKKILAEEGVFLVDRKKELPLYPRRVAIITSPTGAAIQDIIRVISRRSTAPHLIILPTLVQGSEAVGQIAAQIRRACVYGLGEVIILARGGGSLEDLMCFNDERVVYAIAESSLPIISGVGHETDVTLADLAADVREATPSTAAELISNRAEHMIIKTRSFREQSRVEIEARLERCRFSMEKYAPSKMKEIIESRIYESIRSNDEALRELHHNMAERLRVLRHRFEIAQSAIATCSPELVLRRGYTRVSMNGRNIVSVQELENGDEITVNFFDGAVASRVIRKFKKEILPDEF